MNFEVIFVALCLIFMIWALIADKLKPGLILFSCVVMMLCAGILTPKECLEGFSNKGMITVCQSGSGIDFSEDLAKEILSEDDIDILVNLNDGNFSATAWGCDLTHEYVNINADYRS